MKAMVYRAIFLSVLVLSLVSNPAWATSTVDAYAEVRNPNLQSGPNSYPSATSTTSSVAVTGTYINTAGSPGSFTAEANGGNSPSLNVAGSATSSLGNSYYASPYDSIVSNGHADVTYSYMVSGPANVSVPITYSFAGGYSQSTGSGGWIYGDGYLSFAPGTYKFSWNDAGSDTSLLGSHNLSGTLTANQWYGVHMYVDLTVAENASLIGGPRGAGTSTASAWIDPTVIIDPIWAQNNPGYSLQFDTVTEPVPLPASMLFFAPGLAGLTTIRRKFKK